MENRNGGYGEFYRNSVYTWLLCANHLGIHKDVSRLIAKMIPVDLSGWIKWPGHEGLGKLVVWVSFFI